MPDPQFLARQAALESLSVSIHLLTEAQLAPWLVSRLVTLKHQASIEARRADEVAEPGLRLLRRA